MHLLSSLIFTEVLLVVLDQLLNLVLQLLLCQAVVQALKVTISSRTQDGLCGGSLGLGSSWLRSGVRFDSGGLVD